MKKYALYFLLIFSLAVNMAAAGTLGYHYWQESRQEARVTCGQQPFGRFMRENLQLDREEIFRFKSLFDQDKQNLLQIKNQIHEQRQILFNLLDKTEVDDRQVDQQIEKIAALQAQMEKLVVNRIIKMKSNLSEEKQKRLLEIIRQKSGAFGRGPLGRGPEFWRKGGRR